MVHELALVLELYSMSLILTLTQGDSMSLILTLAHDGSVSLVQTLIQIQSGSMALEQVLALAQVHGGRMALHEGKMDQGNGNLVRDGDKLALDDDKVLILAYQVQPYEEDQINRG